MEAPLYKTLLGEAFNRLPASVQAMHDGVGKAAGRADIEHGRSLLARIICKLANMPEAGSDLIAETYFESLPTGERWTRVFNGQSFQTDLLLHQKTPSPYLMEKFGPLSFRLRVTAHADGVDLTPEGVCLFGLPLPGFLCPEAVGMERERDGRYRFEVSVRFPLAGDVVSYRGWLEPEA